MTSTALLRITRKRPLLSLGTAATGLTTASAFGLEAYADRQESLAAGIENEEIVAGIGLPRAYDREQIRGYWMQRPVSVAKRVGQIVFDLGPVFCRYYLQERLLPKVYANAPDQDQDQNRRVQYYAEQLREALTDLGPAWVKGGQQLAIRPDLVPPIVLKELQKLCDSVRPVPDEIALQLLRDELNIDDLSTVFENLHLVASASLGQVYKARLREPVVASDNATSHFYSRRKKSKQQQKQDQMVAIKVQRPGMRKSFSLDLFLLQQWGDFADIMTSIFTNQAPYHRALFDAFAYGSYSELDYENEAKNQKHFQEELRVRNLPVKVPDVYDKYTTERILTSEWIQGVKLAESPPEKIRELIPVGVELFLTQLLDIGTFHADPHPGNLLVTDDEGILCLLDFGLTADVHPKAREAMTNAIVHLLYRDFDTLVSHDTKELGFLPQDFDTSELKPILTKVLTGGVLDSGSDLRMRKRKLQEISNELNEIFFQYPFQVPPFFALVTRGLGLLEGIALTGDPNFDIFRASAPYATRRAVGLMGRHVTSRRAKNQSAVRL